MKIEARYSVQPDETLLPMFLCLIAENEKESKWLDEFCGRTVSDTGLIAETLASVHLSDGFGEHYIRLYATPQAQKLALEWQRARQ
jgi:hypothetical protein